ncbi:hypothetical protein DOTSEDRAFT_74275 [Dothistroma septosporum NZE10]|uniref:Uncharacterized protein n=1 Tax=Dothistroma septosporum (strain NZE10 / CBS 128990) TaxID=675120 RepID=N1PGK5_DOTSN|nr:hypothetical protein DOTSEDRAFT_74275 [Dothistroma septosporum NZE10]
MTTVDTAISDLEAWRLTTSSVGLSPMLPFFSLFVVVHGSASDYRIVGGRLPAVLNSTGHAAQRHAAVMLSRVAPHVKRSSSSLALRRYLREIRDLGRLIHSSSRSWLLQRSVV